MPEANGPWAGGRKVRLVAKSTVESPPEIERLVGRAVARAKQGDRDAVRFLCMRYADNVFGYVRTIVRDHHDAEGVTQQVLREADHGDRQLRAAWCAFHRLAAADVAQRRRRRHPRAPRDSRRGGLRVRLRHVQAAPERARSLHAALASLPEDQRLERLESAPLTGAAHLQVAA